MLVLVVACVSWLACSCVFPSGWFVVGDCVSVMP